MSDLSQEEKDAALINAAKQSDRDGIEAALALGANPNAVDENGSSVLSYTIAQGFEALSMKLLEAGARTDVIDEHGCPALFAAAYKGMESVCEYLVNTKKIPLSEIDKPHILGTALYMAARQGHGGIYDLLHKAGANPFVTDDQGNSILSSAAAGGHSHICRMILREHPELLNTPNQSGVTPVQHAVVNGETDVCELLLIEHQAICNPLPEKNVTLLMIAANAKIAQMLIDRGVPVDARDDFNLTALHHAAIHGRTDVCATLSKNGASIIATDDRGISPLSMVVMDKNEEICRVLLDNSPLLGVTDEHVQRIITDSIKYHNNSICEMLINHCTDPQAALRLKDENGYNLLEIAALYDNKPFCTLLLGKSMEAREIVGAISCGVRRSNAEICRLLLNNSPRLDVTDERVQRIIISSVKSGNASICEMLINHCTDPQAALRLKNENGYNLLEIAALHNNTPLCQMLLGKGMGTNEIEEAFSYSIRRSNEELCRLLLDNSPPFDVTDEQVQRIIIKSAESGNTSICEMLIDHCADPMAALRLRDRSGKSVLETAAYDGRTPLCQMLLRKGMEAKEIVKAISISVESGNEKICRLLLDHSPQLDVTDERVQRIITDSVKSGNASICEMLINHCTDPQAALRLKDENGYNLLIAAVQFNHPDICRMLIKKGVDIGEPDRTGINAFSWGIQLGYLEPVRELLIGGARVDVPNYFGKMPLQQINNKIAEKSQKGEDITEFVKIRELLEASTNTVSTSDINKPSGTSDITKPADTTWRERVALQAQEKVQKIRDWLKH